MSGAAHGDEVRRAAFEAPLVGIWAPSPDLCASGDSVITISKRAYESAGNRCELGWVVVTPGPFGPTYGVRASCAGPDKTVRAVDSIIRPEGERLLIGSSYETLRPYQRCQ